MYSAFKEFLHNIVFWSAIFGWIVAQCTKVLCNMVTSRKSGVDWLLMLGGMPSAHSSAVGAMTTSVGIHCGWSSPIFGFAITFAVLTMIDASTVRRASGFQATLLNDIVDELFKEHRLSQNKVRELIGHTRLEVLLGLTMGIFVALLLNGISGFPGKFLADACIPR